MKIYQLVDDSIVAGHFRTKEQIGVAIVDFLLSKDVDEKLLEWLRVDEIEVP